MSSRTPFIAGNWKMNKTIAEAEAFIAALLPQIYDTEGVDVAICPPYLALQAMVDSARGSRVGVYAQNMHFKDSGAYTGEVSAAMLSELDVNGVVLGHSERREYHNEDDALVNAKIKAALAAGLTPIFCVGEGLPVREAGNQVAHVTAQVDAGLDGLKAEQVQSLVIAYEPVWAIGTGKTATPEDAQEVCGAIRARLVEVFGPETGAAVRIQYGGSVKSGNIAAIMAQPDVDGALVGGASLDAEEFAAKKGELLARL